MTYPNIVPTGTDLIPYASGLSNLGNPTQYFDKIYVNSVVQTGVGIDPTLFVSTSGGSMYGNLNMSGGSKITGIGLSLEALSGSDITLTGGKDNKILAITGIASISGNAGATINAGTGNASLLGSGKLNISSFNNMSVSVSGSGQLFATNGLYLSGNNGNITLNAGIALNAGTGNISTANSILPTASGTQDIGSTSNYFGTIYANKVIQTGASFTVSGISTDAITKSWVNFGFSGSSTVISGSYNVSSVTYNAVGLYTVNYLTPMPSKNYTFTSTVTDISAGCLVVGVGSTKSTGSMQLVCENTANTKFNPVCVGVLIFGQ